MTTTQTHAAQVLTDAETDQHLDAVLNGAGSALRHYTTEFSLSRMRAAMREHEAAILAKLQPAQAGELPEPDAVFYCSEDTGYLTQYRRPPANPTDGDVAMYEADTVRSLLISAALAARKPLKAPEGMSIEAFFKAGAICHEMGYVSVSGVQRKLAIRWSEAKAICQHLHDSGVLAGLEMCTHIHGIGLEVKP